jgi:predicted DNA-binding WGR domain protein
VQRYELVEGGSSKFWEVEVSGADLTVAFGRIGTAGQSKTKNLGDAAAAIKERDKLIKEKTGKGYTLVDASAASKPKPPSTPKPEPKPAAAPQAAPAELVQEAVGAEPATPASSAAPTHDASAPALTWPSGGFQWKKEWRDALPVVRGIHAPPMEPLQGLLDNLVVLSSGSRWQSQTLSEIANAAGRSWVPWDEAESRRRITLEALNQPELEYWLELMAQAFCSGWQHHHLRWVTKVCIGLHGLPFALEAALTLWEPTQVLRSEMSDLLDILRRGIACASEADYSRVLQTAQVLRLQSQQKKRVCAHLFAHLGDWAVESIGDGPVDKRPFLLDCVQPAPHFLSYIQRRSFAIGWLRPALYLQIHLHGEASFEALACALAQAAGSKDATLDALELLTRMQIPALIPLLVSGIENKEIRQALDKLALQSPAAVLKTAIEYSVSSRSTAIEGWTVRLALREPDALNSALAALEPAVRSRFEARLATLQCDDAPETSLPEVLRNPPWLNKQRQQALPSFEVTTLPTPDVMAWTDAELARARNYEIRPYLRQRAFTEGFPNDLAISAEGLQRLLAGQWLQPGDVATRSYNCQSPDLLLVAPEKHRLALWNSYPANQWYLWDGNTGAIRLLLAEHGLAALPGLLAYLQFSPEKGLPLIEKYDSPQLVGTVLHVASNLKKPRVRRRHGCALTPARSCSMPCLQPFTPYTARRATTHGLAYVGSAAMGSRRWRVKWRKPTVLPCPQRWRLCSAPTRCWFCPARCPSCLTLWCQRPCGAPSCSLVCPRG